jgi:16S rRNA (guanine527-N7)-methyltransferase
MNIEQALSKLGLAHASLPKLKNFITLFEKWNKSINLSAASSRGEVLAHLLDSLHVVPLLPPTGRVLDVGSGGGFPVVIAAACRPDLQFTSLEPVHKKHAFLRTAARELGLANLDARAERLEDHATHDYDVAMSRATFDLGDWLAMATDRVRPGGVVLGFEAVRRNDLPPTVERHAYNIDGKPRTIVTLRRV